ncbi:unnamed protein product [Linum tenue]|uniref:rRNA adenine N(6)-methyltransferase n=1 Tax=Linum tenue TaxID=586396 RepID=A0AAV0PLZ8_9ROSI|nr:unnamed protein product [Linum tenue]
MSSWAPHLPSSLQPILQPCLPELRRRVPRPRPWLSPRDNGTDSVGSKRADVKCARASQKSPDDYHATLRALNSRGRKPRKSLGQHYMLNSEINDQLAGAANVGEGDVVLEIGPGTGSLTNVLISSGATVLAVEKDPYMAALVEERFADTGRLKVVEEDFVKCHIGSHISLLLESLRDSDPEYKFDVPRSSFFPQPNVDAAVVTFKLKKSADYPAVCSTKSFFSLVNSAFNGKRKMLRNTLQHICTPLEIETALQHVGLPATSRPEELTLDDFVKLHNLLVRP